MRLSSLILGGVCAVAVICILLFVLGVNFHAPSTVQGAALYNPANEVTVKGVVTSVDEFDCPVSEGELAVHLALKTADGNIQIHLVPTRIMQGQKLVFYPGDQVELVGAKVKVLGKNGVIARELTRGNESYIFRDSTGKLLMTQ